MMQKVTSQHIKAAMFAALLFLSLFSPFIMNASSKTPQSKKITNSVIPDFAFPETVQKNAEVRFADALDKKNGVEALKSAIEIVVARNQVSHASFKENISMLDSAANLLPQPYSSLFYLLDAVIYTQMYESEAWKYNQRVLPLDSYPEDPYSWSRDLFCKKVVELTDLVMTGSDEAKSMAISELSPVLTNVDAASEYGLSVYDFMVYSCVKNLRTFRAPSLEPIIPFFGIKVSDEHSYPEQCSLKEDELLNSLIKYREDDKAFGALSVAVEWKAENMDLEQKKAFLKLWKDKLIDTKWDARLLRAYYRSVQSGDFSGTELEKQLFGQMGEWYAKFPKAPGANVVEYDMAEMSRKLLSINMANVLLPETVGKGEVKMCNVNSAYVLVYKVPDSMVTDNSVNIQKFPSGCSKIASIPVEAEGTVPFASVCKFELPVLSSGQYVLIPSLTPNLSTGWRNNVNLWSIGSVNVTDLSYVMTSNTTQDNSGILYVVNARNQQPVSGAEVKVYSGNGKKLVKSGLTSSDGSFEMPKGHFRIKISKDRSVVSGWTGYNSYENNEKPTAIASILTDLSIYKPGSDLKFSLVGWTRSSGGNKLLKNSKCSIVLRDANYNPVDSLSLVTDNDGRCNGQFSLPESGLLGTFTLAASFEDYPKRTAGRANVQVAEYKTPGFFVEMQPDSTVSYKAGDILTFKGVVKTFSGMPLNDSKISFKVSWRPWWRMYSSVHFASYGGEVNTDSKGCFEISLPTENLKNTDFAFGTYSVSVTATSPSGETQSAPDFRFSLGADYNISPRIPEKICAREEEIKFMVPVNDMLDLPTVQRVRYSVTNSENNETVAEGEFESPVLTIHSDRLPSGKYDLTFNIVGDTVKTKAETVIWRKSDSKPPFATPLWIPENEIVAKTGEKTLDVEFGSGYSDSWILAIVTDQRGIVKREWLKNDGNNSKLTVDAPKDNGRVWITFNGMHDFNELNSVVSIIPESATKTLTVKAETFRDKIAVDNHESWKFKFTVDGNSVNMIPAFAVMTDKALNALSPFAWHFNVGRNFYYNQTSLSPFFSGRVNVSGEYSKRLQYCEVVNPIPVWNTYGYNLGNSARNFYGVRTTSRALTGSVMIRGVKNEAYDAAEEEQVFASVELQEAPVMASNMAMKKAQVVNDMSTEAIEEAADEGGAGIVNNIELRPVELPVAFFFPELKGDDDGNVTVDFEVPNFNTTWQFQIVGYTEDLLTAGLIKDAVASKQVMVKSNPPRYLRTGDTARISALVFNNSASDIDLGGKIIIFDPLTGNSLASQELKSEKTSPSANRIVNIEWDVPANLSMVGIKAYAYGENHTDGEQTIIPVLPSSTPVIESDQFYIGVNQNSFSRKLPKFGKDANLTLKYCDNPIWECVLALPSVSKPESKNVLSLINAFYANSMADALVTMYPGIKAKLEKVFAEKDDMSEDGLKSNLEKDAALKTVVLSNTPWVNNASSETLRMNNLKELISSSDARDASKKLIDDIKSLQNSDGGWSWCPDMKSSEYISRSVLLKLGMMKKSSILPDECMPMVKKGFAYCDKKIYEDYLKAKKEFSITDMLSYLYVRSFFDVGSGPTGFSSLKTKVLTKISEEWSKFSVYNKAIAAILLSRSKGYERYSGLILESLNQLASKNENRGWWYDNLSSGYDGWSKLSTTSKVLEAFSEIQPSAPAVEGLRQWLVLQKETEDWGASSSTVEIIQAIVSSGSSWTEATSMPVITLGGTKMQLPDGEVGTGVFTVSLDPKLASGKELKIERSSSTPAWGGVISQYVSPIKNVKAEKCENLSIEKKLLVITESASGEIATESPVKVGDRVRVTLTITCDKDMNYVALIDERGAALEPDDQISRYVVKDGLWAYREVRDSRTSFFIEFLPKGVNVITYDCHADRAGEYSIGIASVQSQYSPLQTAHSAGAVITIAE